MRSFQARLGLLVSFPYDTPVPDRHLPFVVLKKYAKCHESAWGRGFGGCTQVFPTGFSTDLWMSWEKLCESNTYRLFLMRQITGMPGSKAKYSKFLRMLTGL
jgi:hypothetical protein